MATPAYKFAASLVVVLTTAASTATKVDGQECKADEVTRWWPRANFTASNDPISAADKTAIESQLGAVEALMRRTPYATPRGFAVKPAFAYHDITSRTHLQPYEDERRVRAHRVG